MLGLLVRLLEPPAWSEKYFAPESHPSDFVMRRWAREGGIPAKKIGKTWFVDEHT